MIGLAGERELLTTDGALETCLKYIRPANEPIQQSSYWNDLNFLGRLRRRCDLP
jgi:hypothetical protein